ncbi:type I methionyl aminopeptidase [Candidatus Villigracilis saccharophilus]|uniref:type I methionyl aminopeptidase n=1 Tax=Candidatus Villigracilis saccharophilus TaxID=3140684 RepID=UPI0031370567|nr:type I methionyl aminopeptidase [Anaerolineales bacterium]
MIVQSEEDIKHLKAIGHICAMTLQTMMERARPGMTTLELDNIGMEFLKKAGAQSAPMAMYHFPGATCISVSPVIAHGIPNERVLQEGDLVNIDVSAEMNGYYGDTGASMVIARQVPEYEKLLAAARSALEKALQVAVAGNPLNLIGQTIQQEAQRNGYGVIFDLTGHGIGHKLHEAPAEVFNYNKPKDRRILEEGLVLAIEPFLTTGKGHVFEERDGWSLRTIDRTIAAQFEHTVIVTKNEPIILTV